MENEIRTNVMNIPTIKVNTNLDFKLEGWPASATLITFCIAGVAIYAIRRLCIVRD